MIVNLDYVLFQNSGFLGYTRNNSECFVFSNMSCASFCLAFRMGEGDNNAKVLHFFEIRGMDTDFSLGKACGECGMIGYRCKYLARSGSVYISKMKAS